MAVLQSKSFLREILFLSFLDHILKRRLLFYCCCLPPLFDFAFKIVFPLKDTRTFEGLGTRLFGAINAVKSLRGVVWKSRALAASRGWSVLGSSHAVWPDWASFGSYLQKFSYKTSPNIWQLFGLFLSMSLFKKKCYFYTLCIFWKIWLTFISNLWSHWRTRHGVGVLEPWEG